MLGVEASVFSRLQTGCTTCMPLAFLSQPLYDVNYTWQHMAAAQPHQPLQTLVQLLALQLRGLAVKHKHGPDACLKHAGCAVEHTLVVGCRAGKAGSRWCKPLALALET